jgi:hypothetical protein
MRSSGHAATASTCLRPVALTAAPRSPNVFQHSARIRVWVDGWRIPTSVERLGSAGLVGPSKVPGRPVARASRRRCSWISRWPPSSNAIVPWPRGRVNLTARGRSRAMPSATQVSSGARVPAPRSKSLSRETLRPTRAASCASVQRRARRADRTIPPRVAAIAIASRCPAMTSRGRNRANGLPPIEDGIPMAS